MRRPIGIDLFAGAGGLSLGFEQAGFDVRAAVEIDPVHCAVHKFNFPECEIISKSVVGLSGEEIRRRAKLGAEKVDVVFGGPPCQGFSLIGHRSLDDQRNRLVLEFVRIVAELDASYFVFENVRGLTIGQQRKFLDEIIEAFDAVGYHVRTPWRVLDAADYGVPQHRLRLILFGAKKGKPLPSYPGHVCVPADDDRESGLPKGPSAKDALFDIPDADKFEELLEGDEVRVRGWKPKSAYAKEMHCVREEDWHFGYKRIWDPKVLTSSNRTQHTDISRRRFAETAVDEVEPISRFYRLAPDGLSNTLRAGTDQARGAFTSPRPIHFDYARCVTVREMARLHGYPDWFRFHVTKWHGGRQIGNSVPPPMARAIAAEVGRALKYRPSQPNLALALGNPDLLTMEMSQAAAHFGIDVPIQRRNKKSGARKRKQEEIEAILLSQTELTQWRKLSDPRQRSRQHSPTAIRQ